jgi:hypothetical protein
MGDLPDFPQEVAWALEESAPLTLERLGEPNDIVLATCHLLAGQLYPERIFADLNAGSWHQQHGEERIIRWLRVTAQVGLPQGESQDTYANALLALSHLVDLAHSDEVAEMAAAVLDKLAYLLALQSFVGAWGGSQESAGEWLPSARLGPLSGVVRLWWGQGAFNSEYATMVALACCENYMLPEIIAVVGLDRQQESWQRRQDAPALLDASPESTQSANRAAFRSGDYLLASLQGDWAAGTVGLLWQATMGPDAVVVGNRPANSSTHPAWQPNYWRGCGAPTRVAQWHDLLLVAYRRQDEALLDFSHAYFPASAFDEVQMRDGWVMARKGNGYLALTATGGVELKTAGRTAQREVWGAAEAIWLVQMGRAASDGTFAQFVEKVLALPLSLEREMVRFTTLRGQSVRFRADGPLHEALLVDEIPQPLDGFPHVESIYGGAATLPATSVEIQYQEHLMRVDFETPELPNVS